MLIPSSMIAYAAGTVPIDARILAPDAINVISVSGGKPGDTPA